MFSTYLPDNLRLEACLAPAFRKRGAGAPRVVGRTRSPYSTTFPCEVITCRLPNNDKVKLFCKYSADVDYTGFGHRGGPAYELTVYRNILQRVRISAPVLYGGHVDPDSGHAWLALEYLHGAYGVGKMHRSGAMIAAAHWAGRFHRKTSICGAVCPPQSIKIYTRQYYLGWVHRTLKSSHSFPRVRKWLDPLCEQSSELLAPLLDPPHCIIHGEFYPHNVLFHRGRVCPVDWESAAAAAGEIDIASLTEDWPAETVRDCITAYQQERWPKGVPPDFARRLRAARLYFCFRWLGDHQDWTQYSGLAVRLRQLRQLGREMKVLE
jgi:hypothetical protein